MDRGRDGERDGSGEEWVWVWERLFPVEVGGEFPPLVTTTTAVFNDEEVDPDDDTDTLQTAWWLSQSLCWQNEEQ